MTEEANSPKHYAKHDWEAIDIIFDVLGPQGFEAYCQGNVLKYAIRAPLKGNFHQDMRKAANYALWASGEEWRDERERDDD